MPDVRTVDVCQFTQGGDMEVLIGTDDCSLLVVTAAGGAVDQELSEKLSTPIDIITVSPNGRCVAPQRCRRLRVCTCCVLTTALRCHAVCSYVSCVGRDTLVVMGTNFETKLLEFNTASDPPSQVVWCAEVRLRALTCSATAQAFVLTCGVGVMQDAVVMSWHGKGVLVVGPLGDWVKYVCEDESVFLAAEVGLGSRLSTCTTVLHLTLCLSCAARLCEGVLGFPA